EPRRRERTARRDLADAPLLRGDHACGGELPVGAQRRRLARAARAREGPQGGQALPFTDATGRNLLRERARELGVAGHGRARRYSPVRIPSRPVGETVSEHVGIERAERSHHAAPPVEAHHGESLRRFVAVALAAFASVLLLTGIANAIVDPLGSVGTGPVQPVGFSHHAARVQLIDQLEQPPQLVVLGSSRALKAEPSSLQQLTGLRGFNAAAANGKTEDGFAYANLFHDRWPDARIRYLWILEVEAFRDRPPSPQLL